MIVSVSMVTGCQRLDEAVRVNYRSHKKVWRDNLGDRDWQCLDAHGRPITSQCILFREQYRKHQNGMYSSAPPMAVDTDTRPCDLPDVNPREYVEK